MEETTSQSNLMLEPRIGKIVVNITVGQSGEPLKKAITILEQITGQRPSISRARQTIRSFGIRRNEPMACKVTLRGQKAEDFLRKGFDAVGNRLFIKNFDNYGNFSFGIKEHIDIPGTKYDPSLGITGMDVTVSIERPGYRVSRRKRARSKIGSRHRVVVEEAVQFIKNRFGTEVRLESDRT